MKPLVSVIVPVYKVEPWLERCLDSLANQTLKEIEIIVIDDGSPDRCGEICDAYAAKDERFRVVHQENRGLSAARNAGIEMARADYLMFVDSDDWVDPEFCRLPYEAAVEHGAKLVSFRYRRQRNGKQSAVRRDLPEGIRTSDEGMGLMNTLTYYIWNKLYHRDLFREIRFPAGRYFEDMVIMPRLVRAADRIYLMSAFLYTYCIRKGSISRTRNEKFILDYYEMRMQSAADLDSWGYAELAQKTRNEASLVYLIGKGSRGEYAKECISCCRSASGSAARSRKRRLLLFLLLHAPPLFDLVCKLSGKRI